ncbi:MAG: cytochrome c biogenesis protein ResB [Syntrophomonadaceae bacterium]|nr:cytochrome c biogenesis protein ResB [Syntrophomonadaceae bacterium]
MNKQHPVRNIFLALTSMQTAIYLLILIALLSAVGTIIPQGEESRLYIQQYGHYPSTFITLLGLDHLYQVWWYQVLLGFLGLSLLLCSYQRLRRTRNLASAGSLILHLGMVVIIVGAAWSLGYAKSVYLEINEGESALLKDYGLKEGYLQLQKFKVDYYPDHTPRQYYSHLSLQDYKGHNYVDIIAVNHPLKAASLKIYQTSWGWSMQADVIRGEDKQRLSLPNGIAVPLPDQNGFEIKALFIPDYQEDGMGVQTKSPYPNNPRMLATLLKEDQIADMMVLAPGESQNLGGYAFVFQGFAPYTGLTIKDDRGVNMVFTGFALLLLGLLIRYRNLYRRKAT